MSTAELKSLLHELVDKSESETLLRYAVSVLQQKEDEEFLAHLSPAERAAVLEGLRDIEEGRVHTHEEVMQSMNAILKGDS